MPANPELVTLNIDGRDIAVPRGTNVIEAARLLNIDVPHYCYHPKLPVVGNCRMCLVEMGMPAVDPSTKTPVLDPTTGKQKINWMPRPQIGCGTTASPGLHIRTTTPMVKDARAGVMEFLLINHPLDCPICDQAGECKLQEQATSYGRGYSRYIEAKNVKPKRTQLGPRVILDDERCILCSRCIRFTKEIAKDDVLGFIDRGSHSTLTCYPGKQLANNYSLNTVDICPVGALTSSDFRFKMRVWFLKQTDSIDTESSVGANTTIWSREGQIYRVTPRRNDEVNDTWMSDSGRLLYKEVRAETRLANTGAPLDELIAEARKILAAPSPKIALIASARSTVEEHYLTKKLADALAIPTAARHLVARHAAGDGILISADRNPNTRGALLTGLIAALPSATTRLTRLAADIEAGEIHTLLVINEDLTAPEAGLTAAQLAKVTILYLGTQANATSAAAKIVIPTHTVFEKCGTFINQQFRLQKFAAAVPGQPGTHNDLAVLAKLLTAISSPGTAPEVDFATLWRRMAEETPALDGLDYATLPESGHLLAAAPSQHAFPEGESLHYKPANKAL